MKLQDALIRDRVADLVMNDPVCVSPTETIARTIEVMRARRTGCVVVQQGEKLRGLFTERDVLKRLLADGASPSAPIESVMTAEPETLVLTDTVAQVIQKMHTGGSRHMPVIDETGRPIGVVSVKRVVQYLVEHFPEAVYNLPPDPDVIATTREGG